MRRFCRIRVQRFLDNLVCDVGAVIVARVDVRDAEIDRFAQDRNGSGSIAGGPKTCGPASCIAPYPMRVTVRSFGHGERSAGKCLFVAQVLSFQSTPKALLRRRAHRTLPRRRHRLRTRAFGDSFGREGPVRLSVPNGAYTLSRSIEIRAVENAGLAEHPGNLPPLKRGIHVDSIRRQRDPSQDARGHAERSGHAVLHAAARQSLRSAQRCAGLGDYLRAALQAALLYDHFDSSGAAARALQRTLARRREASGTDRGSYQATRRRPEPRSQRHQQASLFILRERSHLGGSAA